MNTTQLSDRTRFLATLRIVAKEGAHLEWSRQRLFSQPINATWVDVLDSPNVWKPLCPAMAVCKTPSPTNYCLAGYAHWPNALEARSKCSIAPSNLAYSTMFPQWLEARQLRNTLIHETMEDSASFAENIQLAERYSHLLLETYQRVRNDAATRLNIPPHELPENAG